MVCPLRPMLRAGLRAIRIPPFRSEPLSVAEPAPVLPAVGFIAHAAPTEALLVDRLSYNSVVNAPKVAVVHPENVGELAAASPNIITAALALAVVMLAATTPVWLACTEIVPGVTSKGVAPEVLTPEKATIEPTALVVLVPSANVKLDPSVPSATLYKTAAYRAVVPARLRPSIKVQPDKDGAVVLFPTFAIFTSKTSPATTPVGLLMVNDVLVEVPVVAPSLCAIVASATELLRNENIIVIITVAHFALREKER